MSANSNNNNFMVVTPTAMTPDSQLQHFSDDQLMNAHERARQPMIATGITILVIGTIGNILAFFILRRKALRIYTTAFLLSLLAICDTACLYLGLLSKVLSYVNRGEDVFRTALPYSCQIHVFVLYTFLHFTSWLLGLVSVERFLSTWFPHRSVSVCSIRNAKIAATVLFGVIAGYNSHFFYTMALQESKNSGSSNMPIGNSDESVMIAGNNAVSSTAVPSSSSSLNGSSDSQADAESILMEETLLTCTEVNEYKYFHNEIWPIADLVLFCFGPFGVMLVANTLIAWRILDMRRNGDIVVASTSPSRRLSGMTTIMFACTLTFFALTFPINIYILVRRQYPNEMQSQSNPATAVVWPMVNLLQYLNNACNFFLYCLTGSMFRRELRRSALEWLAKIQSIISVLSNTISEEKADRAAAANSNGRLVLIEIGGRNGPSRSAHGSSRAVLQRLLNRTTQTPRTSCMPMTPDPNGAWTAMNGDSASHQVKFTMGADEPLLLDGTEDKEDTVREQPIYVGPQRKKSSRKLSRLKNRAASSSIFAAARRYRFEMSDSEATSGCYQSAAEFSPTLVASVNGNNNYNNEFDSTTTMTTTSPEGQKNPAADGSNGAVGNGHTASSAAKSSNRHPMNSYRFHRVITAEEKSLLEEFGPHC